MKTIKAFITLLILALLLNSAPTTRLCPTQAAEPQVDAAPTDRTVEPLNTLNDTDAAEQLPSVVQSPADDWRIECVDCPKQFGDMTDRSLRLDSDDHPHIAYGKDRLYYAWHNGTQWHYETVDESPGVGECASLALDGKGRPYISYYDATNNDLKYAWHNGVAWQIETVDSVGGWGAHTSLALDGMGRPHISYCDVTNDDLKYAWHDGTDWQIETVDSEYAVPYTSLALDEAGRPHINYANRYAWHDGIDWQIETVDSEGEGGVGEHSSLALDEAGRPHISYYASGNVDLKYAWHDGAAWQIETVDSEYVGWYTSLALDGASRPHISYYDRINQDLKYAWHDGAAWQIETVDSEGQVGVFTSLALDGAGRPHISHHGNGDLKYTWHDGAVWQIETVDSEGDVGWFSSLALDEAGRSHISYHDFDNRDLKYARHDGTAWQIETVDSEGRVGNDTSLALDEAGRPHISYYDWDNGNLKYAWHDGTDWRIETVDSEGTVGRYTSLALDEAGQPHISYCLFDVDEYNTCTGLKYAWHDGIAWQIETVDNEGLVGWDTSLALDGAGRPHISYCLYDLDYYGLVFDSLKYAWYDGTQWQIETVDSKGWPGRNTSLVLDGADRPHVSYVGSGGILRYAWKDGTDWYTETVDSEGWGGHISLALDEAGRPHVSYEGSRTLLKYAWHDGVSWHTETVDSGDWVGWFSSLALDRSGRPHISYYDFTYKDLKYARLPHLPLSLHKQATPNDTLYQDDILTYTLTLFGSSVRLWDTLPVNVHYITDSITSTVAPPAVYSPTARAVIWQEALPTDTVPVVQFQVAPHITGTGALLVPLSIANTARLTDTENGTTISATASVTVTPGPLFLDKQATPTDGLRNNDTLTYTLTFSGSGQTARLWDLLSANVYYITDSITSTLTPLAVYSPTIKTVIWEGTLPTDTVQEVRFQVTPGITGTGALSLSQPIVNTAWLTVTAGTESGRSVSAMVIVNGRHVYLPLVLRQFP